MTSPFGGAVDLQQHMKAKVDAERRARLDREGRSEKVSATELYDTEVLQIEKVIRSLRQYATDHGVVDYDAYDRQIKDRFNDIGFDVTVNWYETDQRDVKMPEIQIVGRTDAIAFDREQQRHEIISDVLERGEGGTIKMSKDDLAAAEAAGHHKH